MPRSNDLILDLFKKILTFSFIKKPAWSEAIMIDLVNDLGTSVNYQLQNSLYIKKIINNFLYITPLLQVSILSKFYLGHLQEILT